MANMALMLAGEKQIFILLFSLVQVLGRGGVGGANPDLDLIISLSTWPPATGLALFARTFLSLCLTSHV